MSDDWQDIPEDDGITLGPEAALEREIAKSKALKVERLQLKDQVERLTAENRALQDENEALKNRLSSSGGRDNSSLGTNLPTSSIPHRKETYLPNRWALRLLIFNLTALAILLLFLLLKPSP